MIEVIRSSPLEQQLSRGDINLLSYAVYDESIFDIGKQGIGSIDMGFVVHGDQRRILVGDLKFMEIAI